MLPPHTFKKPPQDFLLLQNFIILCMIIFLAFTGLQSHRRSTLLEETLLNSKGELSKVQNVLDNLTGRKDRLQSQIDKLEESISTNQKIVEELLESHQHLDDKVERIREKMINLIGHPTFGSKITLEVLLSLPKPIASSNSRMPFRDLRFPNGTTLPQRNDSDPLAAFRRLKVKDAMQHAWSSYKKYAWGKDELKPVSKSGTTWLNLGVTIVDALDTLWIMDMLDEFKEARDWVESSLSFQTEKHVSFFETTIRELGGLLAAFEMSGDQMFLHKSAQLGDGLLKAFGESDFPSASVNMKKGAAKSPTWTGGSVILSEVGSVQLEFLYLAYHTNNAGYAIKPLKTLNILREKMPQDGLFPLYFHPSKKTFTGRQVSVGALGDSFYEYLLKMWLITDKKAEGYKEMYAKSSDAIINLLTRTTAAGVTYIDQMKNGKFLNKMEHLTCFAPGMLALGYIEGAVSDANQLKVAEKVTKSCVDAYFSSKTGIGSEFFVINSDGGIEIPKGNGKHYLLRPETIESIFSMWRFTHEEKYREWGWKIFEAIERYCRIDGGYSGLQDVEEIEKPVHDDLQQSFFLAETLKYLYLLFSPSELIPLDQYVFNTEAHPLSKLKLPFPLWPPGIVENLAVT